MKGAEEANPIANFWKQKGGRRGGAGRWGWGFTFFAFSFNNFIVVNINR